MTLENIFKKFVLFQFIIFIFAILFLIFFENENLIDLQDSLNLDSFLNQYDQFNILIILFLIMHLVSLYMIYKFYRLGRTLYLLTFLFFLILSLIDGNIVMSSIMYSLDYIDAVFTGVILTLIYLSPLKEKFDKSNN